MRTAPYHVDTKGLVYTFSRHHPPRLRVSDGSRLEIETCDCFENQLQRPEDTLTALDWNRVNPATGPLFVEGAEPGDVLAVTIEAITVNDQGVLVAGHEFGVLASKFDALHSRLVPVRRGRVVFDDRLSLPVRPMIGVIGVAPAGDPVNCGTPGSHGGNMDTTLIAPGATVYFPVAVPGALFALGDLHAAMGDGEVSGAGVEIAGQVTLELAVRKDLSLAGPVVATAEGLAAIASAPTLDDAANQAVRELAELLFPRLELSWQDLAYLFSVAGNLQICQVVDPLKTARFLLPWSALAPYGMTAL